MRINRANKIAIGLIVSISLIFYLFYKIDFASVMHSVSKFNVWVLLVLIVVYVVGMGLRTSRWQLLIGQRLHLSFILVFKALVIGYMINNLLPAKVGELARMEYIKRKRGVGRSFLIGTIFIERLTDLLIVLVIFVLSLLFSKNSWVVFSHNQWVLYFLSGVMFLSVYFMLKPNIILWFINFLPQKMKLKLEQIIASFTEAIKFTRKWRLFCTVGFLSVLIWGLTLLTAFSILWGLGITLPIYGYLFLVAVGVLGLVIPSTSGSIGVYHAIATGALVLMNIAPEKALSYAIISHAFDFIPNVVIGLVVSFNESVSFKQTEFILK